MNNSGADLKPSGWNGLNWEGVRTEDQPVRGINTKTGREHLAGWDQSLVSSDMPSNLGLESRAGEKDLCTGDLFER